MKPARYGSRGASRDHHPSSRPPETKNIVTAQDYEELRKHYKFVLPAGDGKKKKKDQSTSSTWQDRMVKNYHDHLYKEFAIVDLSVPGRIGLRFRIKPEVVSGKGFETCGNKHCPSYENPGLYKQSARERHLAERKQDESGVGEGLADYEVPFQYVEQNETKLELVKLRLCLACAPLLLERSGSAKRVAEGAKRKAKDDTESSSSDSSSSDESSDSSDSYYRKRKSRRRRKKKSRKRHIDEEETGDGSRRRESSRKTEEDSDSSDLDDDSSRNTSRRRRRKEGRRKHKKKRRKEKDR